MIQDQRKIGSFMLGWDAASRINWDRCQAWHGKPDPWTLADWGNALAGEVGEACNIIKKIRRIDLHTVNAVQAKSGITRGELVTMLAQELADAFLYLDLLATSAGIDLPSSVVTKFNAISVANNFPHRF